MRCMRLMVPLVALLAAAMLAGCGGQSASDNGGQSASDNIVFASARARTDRVVVYFHGANQSPYDILAEPKHKGVSAALIRSDYAIAAADAGGTAWGDDASVNDYLGLINRLRSRGYTRFYFLAESMGAYPALRVALRVKPLAMALLYPLCDLRSVPAVASDVRSAWNGRIPSLPRATNVPLLVFASPYDSVVPKAENADQCVAQARMAGAPTTLVQTTGAHGDKSNFQPTRVVSFFQRYSGQRALVNTATAIAARNARDTYANGLGSRLTCATRSRRLTHV